MSLKLTPHQMIELLGGVKKVSKKFNISVQAVYKWQKENEIPAEKLMMLAALIEKESYGLVTRKDMFPNHWSWIWPELLLKNNT